MSVLLAPLLLELLILVVLVLVLVLVLVSVLLVMLLALEFEAIVGAKRSFSNDWISLLANAGKTPAQASLTEL